jgi:hypothetical protein
MADLYPDGPKAERRIVSTYDYADEAGTLLYQVVRFAPKDFRQRRPDGTGGWVWDMKNVRRVLYRLPAVIEAVRQGETVYVCEGEKDCDAVNALDGSGFVATCNPGGAGKWRAEHAECLRGASRVVIVADKDEPGRRHALDVRASLKGIVDDVRIVEAKTGKDAYDHLAAGHGLEELAPFHEGVIAAPSGSIAPCALDDVVATVRKWMFVPDPRGLYAALGAYAANAQQGDPVWLLMVGASGTGKTEAVATLAGLDDVFAVSTLTEASLLSGTSKKDKAKDAKGGLLREIGDRGVLLVKDFTSILSMHHDARAGVLAALREIYDGAYARHVGTDGGRSLSWAGRIGLVGCTTPVIDNHHAVMASMGERFLFFRMPDVDRHTLTRSALGHARTGAAMRAEIAEAVRGLLAGMDPTTAPEPLGADETDRLIYLADYTSTARSAVERDGRSREIELIVGVEAPTRLAIGLSRLLGGMRAIGVDSETAWNTTVKVALDCIPAIRRQTLDTLPRSTDWTTAEVSEAIAYPAQTTRRTLEDLHAYGMVDRQTRGQGKADYWNLSAKARDLRKTFPEKSEVA